MKNITRNTFWWTLKLVSENLVQFRQISNFINLRVFFVDQIHNPNSYVRDFYFFSRAQHPQLSLVHMAPGKYICSNQFLP